MSQKVPKCPLQTHRCTNGLVPLSLAESDHHGNVLIGSRPICDDFWDEKEASVICRQLGFGPRTKAIATAESAFGSGKSNYLVDDVQCSGNEKNLKHCSYKTRNNCGASKEAGVICVDPAGLRLVGGGGGGGGGGDKIREGNVFIGNFPVCHNSWDLKDAQVVCNSLFESSFGGRSSVPVFEPTVNSAFGNSAIEDFIMDAVDCKGSESVLTQCGFRSHDRVNCKKIQVAGVRCARCTPDDLLQILGLVAARPNVEETKKSFEAARQRLKAKCFEWDCSLKIPVYPEYCRVEAFLRESEYLLKRDLNAKRRAHVSLRFGSLLVQGKGTFKAGLRKWGP